MGTLTSQYSDFSGISQALSGYTSSANAWKKALDCLPAEGELTDTEKKFKAQYSEGLRKAQQAAKEPPRTYIVVNKDAASGLPWARAEAAEAQLKAKAEMSSVGAIPP